MCIALFGRPISRNVVNINSCDNEWKAEEKSINTQAPFSFCSEVIMLAVSISKRFAAMDLPGKKPCWRGKIHFSKCVSHLFRAALASRRLSEFTMLSGRVFGGV